MSSALYNSPLHLKSLLDHLGLQEYHEVLANHGFGSWHNLIDITEEDMTELKLKLGHRRKLQRAIAGFRGKPHYQPLDNSPSTNSNVEFLEAEASQTGSSKDSHVPQRPQDGYVLFIKSMRQDPDIANLSLADSDKLAGQRWRGLSPEERERWTAPAADQKSQYDVALSHYHRNGVLRYQDRLRVQEDDKYEYE